MQYSFMWCNLCLIRERSFVSIRTFREYIFHRVHEPVTTNHIYGGSWLGTRDWFGLGLGF
jgi:hypothetical protein